jgi:hypothetical protein
MTRPEAEAIIRAHKDGKPISALLLQEAVRCTRRKSDNRITHWPELPRPIRDHANAVLLFNLGKCIRA